MDNYEIVSLKNVFLTNEYLIEIVIRNCVLVTIYLFIYLVVYIVEMTKMRRFYQF